MGRGVPGDELIVMRGGDPQITPVAGRRRGRGARCRNGVHIGRCRKRRRRRRRRDFTRTNGDLRRGNSRGGGCVHGTRGAGFIPALRRRGRLRPPYFKFFARLKVRVSGDPGLPPPLGHQAPAVTQHHVVDGGGEQRVCERLHAGGPGAPGQRELGLGGLASHPLARRRVQVAKRSDGRV